MDINKAFPSKYIKSEDIKGRPPVTVTMSHVTMEKMENDGDEKPVLYFHGAQKGLVLNKTNANMIAHMYGPNTDGWTNQQITLRVEPVSFQGKIVDSIRVSVTGPAPGYQPPPSVPETTFDQTQGGVSHMQQTDQLYAEEQQQTAQTLQQQPQDDFDDDVPF